MGVGRKGLQEPFWGDKNFCSLSQVVAQAIRVWKMHQAANTRVQVIHVECLHSRYTFLCSVIRELHSVNMFFLSRTVLGFVSRRRGRDAARPSGEGASRVAVCLCCSFLPSPSQGVPASQAYSLWRSCCSHEYPSGQIPVEQLQPTGTPQSFASWCCGDSPLVCASEAL